MNAIIVDVDRIFLIALGYFSFFRFLFPFFFFCESLETFLSHLYALNIYTFFFSLSPHQSQIEERRTRAAREFGADRTESAGGASEGGQHHAAQLLSRRYCTHVTLFSFMSDSSSPFYSTPRAVWEYETERWRVIGIVCVPSDWFPELLRPNFFFSSFFFATLVSILSEEKDMKPAHLWTSSKEKSSPCVSVNFKSSGQTFLPFFPLFHRLTLLSNWMEEKDGGEGRRLICMQYRGADKHKSTPTSP